MDAILHRRTPQARLMRRRRKPVFTEWTLLIPTDQFSVENGKRPGVAAYIQNWVHDEFIRSRPVN